MSLRFVPPCRPCPAERPPSGDAWLHEPKLDGWRCIAVKRGAGVALYSRNGADLTRRFPGIADAVRKLHARAVTLDGELVARTSEGVDFRAVSSRHATIELWVFDLIERDGRDLRNLSLMERKRRLGRVMRAAEAPLHLMPAFDDGAALFSACEMHGFEGVVSKVRSSPYRAGASRMWLKSKAPGWRMQHRERWRMFERRGRAYRKS